MTSISTANESAPARRDRSAARRARAFSAVAVLLFLAALGRPALASAQEPSAAPEAGLLKLLGLTASEESLDYVMNKTQFQLHTLLTEQRHPKTMNLSERIQSDIPAGLRMLLSVDEDVAAKLERLAEEPRALEDFSAQLSAALLEKHKIYIYGCGATGRLAKQIESTFWRPFWKRIRSDPRIWAKLRDLMGEDIEDRLIGEMTGGDRALISSLEGFEDLQLMGRLQLEDRKVRRGDAVIAVTEGGETSSVIGTILAACDQWKSDPGYRPTDSCRRLYFIYNNPDEKLIPFERSRKVLEEPGITKINLTTGPQAITGSTRMQAATIETYVVGHVLQDALARLLGQRLSKREMSSLGFGMGRSLADRLRDFTGILKSVGEAVPALAAFTELEGQTYAQNHFSTYFAESGLITVFIDNTERSPTFRLYPLDTIAEPKRRCWTQVWTLAPDSRRAWQAFLGRAFRGLAAALFQKPFEEEVEDPYLRTAALESLKKAGSDQEALYDFSFSETALAKRGPAKGDLGVAAALDEDETLLVGEASPYRKFIDLFRAKGCRTVFLAVGRDEKAKTSSALELFLRDLGRSPNPALIVRVRVPGADDAFGLNPNIALKVMLNAHSTAVMARLGRVIGNTMTHVSPSNLKLIGRATFLIQSHVNDALSRPPWVERFGLRRPVTYGEANAVLFDSVRFLKDRAQGAGQTAEVGLSIVRILESLRESRGLSSEEALGLLRKKGLGRFLAEVTVQQ